MSQPVLSVIAICHACPHAKRASERSMVCTADPEKRDILKLKAAHFCPLGKFPEKLAGDVMAAVIHKATGRMPCGGCLKAHKAVNKVHKIAKRIINGI